MTSGRLQDIEAMIESVKDGKKSKITHWLNRYACPFILAKRYSDDNWLRILEFERKQELEKIRFFNNFKKGR